MNILKLTIKSNYMEICSFVQSACAIGELEELVDQLPMGAGGQSNIASIRLQGGERKKGDRVIRRAPYSKPPFTLGQLKQAIPPHCFRRSLFKSFTYLVYDLTLACFLYFIASSIIPTLHYPFSLLAWPIYWALQGCIFTSVCIIAHECGHHAFSDYQIVDDFVGLIIHSFLFTPYFSWKYSHHRHHSNTGSLERDEAFVPKPKSKIPWYSKYMNNTLGRLGTLIVMLILGWPLYLIFNAAGHPYDRFACHYDPFGPIFSKRERVQVFISDLAILGMVILLYQVAIAKGLFWLINVYGIPLLVVNSFIVTITYLQHTHPTLPHYNSTEWEWLKGALSTVDRDYGVLNKVFHNVTDTHVTHHLFSTIPHYHAMEATRAIKHILGEYYQFDGTPIYKALWREVNECLYVKADEDLQNRGVFWYQNEYQLLKVLNS